MIWPNVQCQDVQLRCFAACALYFVHVGYSGSGDSPVTECLTGQQAD